MKNSIIILFFLLGILCNNHFSSQNYCANFGAFLSPSYPTSTSVIYVNIDTVSTYYGQTFYTKLKIAKPVGDILPFVKRPLIIGVHGGGFISDSISMSATNGYLSMFNNMYNAAQFGYIGASLDYRTGYGLIEENTVLNTLISPGFPACNAVTSVMMERFDNASYFATFDCLKAVDYICKNANLFPYIDTNQIYLYGSSAGAIVVLNAVLAEVNEFISLPISQQLPFPTRHKISGVISLSGAVNKSTALKLESSQINTFTTPLFLAHGNQDTVLSNQIAPVGNCTNISNSYLRYGSSFLSEIACSKNIPHQLFLIDSSGHDLGAASSVSNTLVTSSFTYFYNTGICPSFPLSVQKLYDLEGNLISNSFCTSLKNSEHDFSKIDFKLYPNPTTSELNLLLPNQGATEIKIVNLEGRVLLSKNVKANENVSEQVIDISNLSSGMYFVTMKQGDKIGQKSFVKL
jgi:hypothetical protein